MMNNFSYLYLRVLKIYVYLNNMFNLYAVIIFNRLRKLKSQINRLLFEPKYNPSY